MIHVARVQFCSVDALCCRSRHLGWPSRLSGVTRWSFLRTACRPSRMSHVEELRHTQCITALADTATVDARRHGSITYTAWCLFPGRSRGEAPRRSTATVSGLASEAALTILLETLRRGCHSRQYAARRSARVPDTHFGTPCTGCAGTSRVQLARHSPAPTMTRASDSGDDLTALDGKIPSPRTRRCRRSSTHTLTMKGLRLTLATSQTRPDAPGTRDVHMHTDVSCAGWTGTVNTTLQSERLCTFCSMESVELTELGALTRFLVRVLTRNRKSSTSVRFHGNHSFLIDAFAIYFKRSFSLNRGWVCGETCCSVCRPPKVDR